MKIAYSYFDVIHVFLNGLLFGGCVVTWYKSDFFIECMDGQRCFTTHAHTYIYM